MQKGSASVNVAHSDNVFPNPLDSFEGHLLLSSTSVAPNFLLLLPRFTGDYSNSSVLRLLELNLSNLELSESGVYWASFWFFRTSSAVGGLMDTFIDRIGLGRSAMSSLGPRRLSFGV